MCVCVCGLRVCVCVGQLPGFSSCFFRGNVCGNCCFLRRLTRDFDFTFTYSLLLLRSPNHFDRDSSSTVHVRAPAARPARAPRRPGRRGAARGPGARRVPRARGAHGAQSSVGTAHKFKSFKYIFSPPPERLSRVTGRVRLHRAQPSVYSESSSRSSQPRNANPHHAVGAARVAQLASLDLLGG